MSDESKATILGDFKLRKKLGQGGMGTVYLGHQQSLDRPCAVKILSKEFAAKPGFVERFIREARAMAKINHPNVVDCYAVGEEKGYNYVAMELMDGQSMQDWLNQLGKLSVADAVLVTLVCAEALHHAHELNMIHRDVKPDNILVTKKGVIKVSDMGLAKAVDDDDMSLTQSGTGLGTPHYMAPEQARNAKHVDRRVDVYALGCTLYHFVTGKTPFDGGSVVELIVNKEKGQFTPAKRLNNEVPERLGLIIDKSMAPNPAHRYQSLDQMIADLEALGIAGEALSFIDEELRIPVRRGGTSGRTGSVSMQTTTGSAPKPQPTTRGESKKSSSSQQRTTASGGGSDGNWFVKQVTEGGKTQVGKMTTAQILTAMKTDKLNGRAQVSQSAKGTFLPLAQVPVFEAEAKKMITRQQSQARDTSLAKEYEKLAKQYERRKWWDLLRRMTNNTLGIVGLLIWLGVIAVVGYVLYLAIPYLFNLVADGVGLGENSPVAPPPAPGE